MYASEPRNWKWMVPGMLFFVALAVWTMAYTEWEWGTWAMIPMGFAIVFAVSTLVNAWAFVAERWAETFATIRTALNATPEVRMFEAAKGMHPEAVKALMVHRRTIWRIKYVPLKDVTDWILDEAPTVHAGFVDFVLDHSNGALMPKHSFLSEGSKQYDADGIVTDYQQYDDLVLLMQQKLMVTAAYGNQPPKFIPPWDADLLRRRFGLDGGGQEFAGEMSDAMQTVLKSQQQAANGNGNAKTKAAGAADDSVLASALQGLQQTQVMRTKTDQLLKNS